ncbi:hypothetical protein GW931_01920 [archaeon]|nr:hypothetical protein [archaeon]
MLKANFTLLPVGEKGVDVSLRYLIKDLEGKIYSESSEVFYVDQEKKFSKEFDISNLLPNDYVLGVEMTYIGGFATASIQFEIFSENPLLDSNSPLFQGIVAVIFVLIWIGIIYFFLNSRKKDRYPKRRTKKSKRRKKK